MDDVGRLAQSYLREHAQRLQERAENCHEEVACPKCHAPVGMLCARVDRRMSGGGGYLTMTMKVGLDPGTTTYHRLGKTLKHPHKERWTQVVPER